MRRITLCCCLVTVGVARSLHAHEPESLPIAPPPALQPIPMDPTSLNAADPLTEQLERVLRKLETLEPGDDEAALRAKARGLSDIILTRKEAQVDCLLAEIERLRRLTDQPQSVLLKLVAIEVRRDLLGDLAPQLDELLGGRQRSPSEVARGDTLPAGFIRPASAAAAAGFRILDSNPFDHPLIERLREKRILKVLAEPSLVSATGRLASFVDGGSFPIEATTAEGSRTVLYKPFGTQLEFIATARPGNRLRLQTKFELSEKQVPSLFSFGSKVPELTTRGINTEIDLLAGQTAVIAGLVSRRKPSRFLQDVVTAPTEDALEKEQVTELCVFITPELVAQPGPPARLAPLPTDDEAGHPQKIIVPASFPDDLQYFPPTPIPRKGTLR